MKNTHGNMDETRLFRVAADMKDSLMAKEPTE
jgi:hypothetical protein